MWLRGKNPDARRIHDDYYQLSPVGVRLFSLPLHACMLPCPYRSEGCRRTFKNRSGRTQHINREHRELGARSPTPPAASPPPNFDGPAFGDDPMSRPPTPPPPPEDNAPRKSQVRVDVHPDLDGRPCDKDGNFVDPNTKPRKVFPPEDDFSPYESLGAFRMADFVYRKVQMSAGEIDELFEIMREDGGTSHFKDHKDLYETIDATERGQVEWLAFDISYEGDDAESENAPGWKGKTYRVYYRDPRKILHQQLGNPDFKDEMDYAPKRVFDEKEGRVYRDFMSGHWAWRQADELGQNPENHGAVLVPVIAGSDKTTTSVATGQNDFYPLYISNGLIHNTTRRAHQNGVSLVVFLAIPKTDREHADSAEFRKFRRQLFHASLNHIFSSFKMFMETPEVVQFGDGHYRRVIYCLGPYIADYPEQVLLACVVQGWCARCTASNKNLDGEGGRRTQEHTDALFEALDHKTLWDQYGIIPDVLPYTWDFPRADIHELLSPDLLHQVIKGTFKDHLITWVGEYLDLVHGKTEAAKIMADIDRRIAVVPPFPGLRRFPEGRGFKQWTGDDSKALMKVYLAAIEGYVPTQMLRAFSAFLEFCYLVRRNTITERTLDEIKDALSRYHKERVIFEDSGVCPNGFCLPRQHSLTHYPYLITEFAAPNGLCSSITESKHIKAVKEPWRRSSKFEAVGQMLTINNRLDALAASRVDFEERGLLHPADLDSVLPIPGRPAPLPREDEDNPDNENKIMAETHLARLHLRNYYREPERLANFLKIPSLPALIRRFLYSQSHPDDDLAEIDPEDFPPLPTSVKVFPSAVASFHAPSDVCNAAGVLHERIRAVRSWRGAEPRYDCVFVSGDDAPGFRGSIAARVLLFMSFKVGRTEYPCALVTWFSAIGDAPCPDIGMWMVEPDLDGDGERILDIIHVDAIVRAAHLVPIFNEPIPLDFHFSSSLDSFQAYYINKSLLRKAVVPKTKDGELKTKAPLPKTKDVQRCFPKIKDVIPKTKDAKEEVVVLLMDARGGADADGSHKTPPHPRSPPPPPPQGRPQRARARRPR
uniref:C2H2-type domain-containing protein n=1 Tax=Mycena chlorophos TaxID=658473 RepID=A0ABQ0M1F8_MYCCL|nr:predicted protein [Mycena chlorophos]